MIFVSLDLPDFKVLKQEDFPNFYGSSPKDGMRCTLCSEWTLSAGKSKPPPAGSHSPFRI
ncbi:hypothetical protein SAMN04488574_1478 [Bacillus sp. 71mf]|nr:hypothetical protein SAMN04488574_1478 [Bacillus sp. 71mf]SFT22678.1 hypothetical protein SAMN04488145_12522 [Bacillus sp. 103mf]